MCSLEHLWWSSFNYALFLENLPTKLKERRKKMENHTPTNINFIFCMQLRKVLHARHTTKISARPWHHCYNGGVE